MERKSGKRYTSEFKAQAVKRHRMSGKSLSESARRIGVSSKSLGKWMAEAAGEGRSTAAPARVYPVVETDPGQTARQDVVVRMGSWSVRIEHVG